MPIAKLTIPKGLTREKLSPKVQAMGRGSLATQDKAEQMGKTSNIIKAAGKSLLKDVKKYAYDRPLDSLNSRQSRYYTKPNAKQIETLKKYSRKK